MKRERQGSGSAFLLAGKRQKDEAGEGAQRTTPAAAKAAVPPLPGEDGVVAPSSDMVLLGEFGRAHGLKGEIRLKSHTGDPLAIASYGPLSGSRGQSFVLSNPRQAPGNAPDILVVRVEGITTREAAEKLARQPLYIARQKLPAADDEDEFLLADLIGLPVRTPEGDSIGIIVDVPNFGGGDLLEIRPATGGATAFLPFTRAFVPHVLIREGYVTATPPDDLFAAAKPPSGDAGDEA